MTQIPAAGLASTGSTVSGRPSGDRTADPRPPLSFTQEQLWFIDEFHHGLPAHNVPSLIWLRGQLDVAALERALGALVARHEPLRTRLVAGPHGHPVQAIDVAAGGPELELTDCSASPPEAAVRQVRKLADGEALRPFHLPDEHPLRTRLARITDDEHALVLVTHQTVADDWSMRVLLADLTALYRAEVTGQPAGLAELPMRFADYAAWERQHLRGQVLADAEEYWRATLAGYETTRFPADRPRPLLADHSGAIAQTTVDLAVLDRLRKLSRDEGTTLPVTLLAGLLALLHRYTGQADLVAGTVIPHPAGVGVGTGTGPRAKPELALLLAALDSPLPIRAQASGDIEFRQFLARVHEAVTEAQAHQDLPFARIVEALPIDRDPGRFPVFQTAFSYSEPPADIESAGVTFSCERIGLPAAKYDLGFLAEPHPDGLRLEATYTPALFDPATVDRLLGNLGVLLRGVAEDPSARIGRLPVLTEAELRAEIHDWNATQADLPVQCIHEGFEDQAARTPDAIAAEFADEQEQVSYAELNRQANRVARRLRDLGIGPEALAGACLPTGLRRLAALLGILKAGAGYVPLDPALPAERLAFMINDTGMTVILTDDQSQASVPDVAGVTVVSLDAEWDRLSQLPGDDLNDTGVTPANVAYVIYTSGSTGQPKGVVVEHRQAINFLHGMTRHWRIGAGSAVLQFAAFTFDVSVMDMFMPLLGGAKVVLAAPETLHSPPRLAALLRDANITFACLPPAVLTLLTGEEFPELRTLLSAGEELSSELLRAWQRNGGGTMEFYNGYGPTEASIGSTFMKLEPSTPLPPPIGRPKPNYQAYVLDAYLNPVPVGVTGELHIGGAGVARGYLNRPELTRERFIPDPFIPGQRLYKTGDLVRRRPDGTLEFAGRIDHQVKIRGLRVELGEIEAALVAHPDVAQAVVTVVTDSAGVRQLAGYLRAAEGAAVVISDLRRRLARSLPAYMIPTYLIALDELPLTAHGKIDKAALPLPRSASDAAADRVPPQTLLEAVLVGLFARLLGAEQVGATESFFDAGGNSLQAMGLIAELRTALAVDLDLAALFLTPTPRQLAAVLRDTHGLADSDLGPEGVGQQEAITAPRGQADDAGTIPRRRPGLAELPLSHGQEQLWLIDRLTPGLANYNIPQVLRLSGPLDRPALERALGGLIARHEVLRTRLVADGQGSAVQVIDPAGTAVLEVLDASGVGRARLRELVLARALRPFDLAAGPLLRAALVRLGEAEHALVMVFHHAVFDGWSAGVLRRDLAALYRDEATRQSSPEEDLLREKHGSGSAAANPRPVPALPELPVQFADYAVWERGRLRGELLAGLESYWRGVLEGF
jgi:amino acid adenylation domain-containing protein